ncbi:signal transducer and transcription activator 6-like [Manacus vitellinus]|uniref:signal transducer and transcription activator 6-like n=1 Tax=Manacus vitellinus TaxID=328815 RepID=UPI00115CB20F|nr:signal transducer and transcription activator 6-like [Manacus vitellinus]
MSLWNIVSHMPQEELSSLSPEFPRSLRCLLADWLENQPWEFISGSDAFCTSVASRLFSAMLEKLRGAAGAEGQQCQVLQQVNGLEVCGDPRDGPPVTPISRLVGNELVWTQRVAFWGVPDDRGGVLCPRADLSSADR